MGWQTSDSKAIAHTMHVAALAGLVGPGYARRDATLRRSAEVASVELEDTERDLAGALKEAVATGRSPWADTDQEWFDRRWSMGEADAIRTQGMALCEALNAIELPWVTAPEGMVQTSGAAGARPLVVPGSHLVIAAPRTPGRALCLSWLGSHADEAMADATLAPEDRRWMAEQVACVAIRRAVGEARFADWLPAVMAHLVADFEQPSAVEGRVRRIAEACLDQPPGEIERIGLGLGRRQTSRLDRAVRRGFFVPLGFDFEAWLEATLNAEKGPSAH